MKSKILFLIFIVFILSAYAEDEYNFDVSFLADSIYNDLNDYSSFLTEEMRDEIIQLVKSKDNVTYKKIFEITSNEFVSKSIYEKIFDREKRITVTAGLYSDSVISKRVKTFAKQTYKVGEIKEFALIEKDIGEEQFYDNLKAGISYSTFILGHYRIKTGRGLFSDYSDYFSLSESPFYSDRCELNATYDEYPSYFGCMFSKIFGKYALTGFASYDFYDSRIDSEGNVIAVLKYNLHDDSLSISRDDNLKALTMGIIGRDKSQYANLAFSYTNFSRYLIENSGRRLYLLSLFGKIDILSYDAGYSFGKGLSLSCGLKKSINGVLFNSGFLTDIGYYNPHAKMFAEKKSFQSGFAEISVKLPLRIKEKLEYTHEDETNIENRIDLAVIKNIDIAYKTDIDCETKHSFIIAFKGFVEDYASLKNTYLIKSTGTYTARAGIMLMSSIIRSCLFGFYCNVSEGDMVSAYGYSIESVYPLRSYYGGESYLFGLLFESANSEKAKYNFLFTYDSSRIFRAGISFSLSFF